jgi:hypothetical protein
MAASLPSTAAGWTDWMVAFMAQTLGGGNGEPQRGRAPCSAAERALGQARPSATHLLLIRHARDALHAHAPATRTV